MKPRRNRRGFFIESKAQLWFYRFFIEGFTSDHFPYSFRPSRSRRRRAVNLNGRVSNVRIEAFIYYWVRV